MQVAFSDWKSKPLLSITKDKISKKHSVLGEQRGEAYANLSMRMLTLFDTKNNQAHTLPLSDFLFDLFQVRFNNRISDYVFPGTGKNGYIIEPRKQINRVIQRSGVIFTPHDLRRTFITIAEGLNILSYALKRLVNHKMSNDVTAGYIVSDVDRLRIPMQQITDFLMQCFNVARAHPRRVTGST